YSIGTLGFWLCGYAIMFGGAGSPPSLGGGAGLERQFSFSLGGHDFGLVGLEGFGLHGLALNVGVLAIFLFQLMFLDTAATIPTGAMAERWKFLSFVIFGFFMSMVIYPVYGHWVWGHGWLSQLGS